MPIVAQKVCKQFGMPPTRVLRDIDCTIEDGAFVAITGKSGSGKSTLLYILSTLDTPSSGEILLSGKSVQSLSSAELHRLRNEEIGFVFQFHYLLPELTTLENVLMPARKRRREPEVEPFAIELLSEFGLKDKLGRFPSQLSGGEQQRVAIARALSMKPRYLFADEPTGNLDSQNGEIVMNILQKMNRELKTAIVMVTHDPDFAAIARTQIKLVDGQKVNDA